MDPNAALKDILSIARQEEETADVEQCDLSEAVCKFLDLHRHIMGGGFLPDDWAATYLTRPVYPVVSDP